MRAVEGELRGVQESIVGGAGGAVTVNGGCMAGKSSEGRWRGEGEGREGEGGKMGCIRQREKGRRRYIEQRHRAAAVTWGPGASILHV